MATRFFPRSPSTGIDWLSVIFVLLAILAGGIGALLIGQFREPWMALGLGFGMAIALLTFAHPQVGLLALIVMTYLRFSDVMIQYHSLPSTAQPFVALLAVTIILRWIVRGERWSGWASTAFMVILYGLIGFASLLYGYDYQSSYNVMSDYIKDVMIAVIISILLQRANTLRYVIWALLGTGILMGSISVFQQLTGSFQNNFGGFGQANIQNIIGQVNNYRVAGPIGDPNYYAQILVVLVPLALERLANERSARARLFAGWALCVCVLSIVFTFSRGGFVALIIVIAVWFLRRPPHPIVVFAGLALVVLLSEFMPANYIDRLSTIPASIPFIGGDVRNEISVRGRASETGAAWAMFIDHPLLGVGVGNYPLLYQDYSRLIGLDPRTTNREPHDLYLEVAAESGVLGLAIFGFILWFMFRELETARAWFERAKQKGYSAMVLAIEASFIGYLTTALFLHNAYPRFFWLLFGIALALPHVARNELKARAVPIAGALSEIS